MRLKLKAPILDYENLPITVPPDNEVLTFFEVFVNALNNQVRGEVMTAETKSKIYQLTKKIYSEKEPNFTPEQCTLIKERVGASYAPMVYGKVCDVLDGIEEAPEPLKAPEPAKPAEEKSAEAAPATPEKKPTN